MATDQDAPQQWLFTLGLSFPFARLELASLSRRDLPLHFVKRFLFDDRIVLARQCLGPIVNTTGVDRIAQEFCDTSAGPAADFASMIFLALQVGDRRQFARS